MTALIAALPMYDWPEVRAAVDADWATIRAGLIDAGLDAPATLVRSNADMPAVPGGIRDGSGAAIAPDPATLPPEELDFQTLWRHTALLFCQTCWGPLETTDLGPRVRVIGQPDYSAFEGGAGELYSSAVVMRRRAGASADRCPAPADGRASLPLALMRGARLAFNEPHSMSGMLALSRDLDAMGEGLSIFSDLVETGGHRLSIRAVAEGRADVATVDCRSWDLALRFEPAAREVEVVGWTMRRKGLPYIAAGGLPDATLLALRRALGDG